MRSWWDAIARWFGYVPAPAGEGACAEEPASSWEKSEAYKQIMDRICRGAGFDVDEDQSGVG